MVAVNTESAMVDRGGDEVGSGKMVSKLLGKAIAVSFDGESCRPESYDDRGQGSLHRCRH